MILAQIFLLILFALIRQGFTADITNALRLLQSGRDNTTIVTPLVSPTQLYVPVIFNHTYDNVPQVLIYFSDMSVKRTALQDYSVSIKDVSRVGFTIAYYTTIATNTMSFMTEWMAFETSNDAEVISVNFKAVIMIDDHYSQSTRSDSLQLTFQNQYDSPPNVSLFLLGLTNNHQNEDSVRIYYSAISTTAATVLIDTWYYNIVTKMNLIALVTKKGLCVSEEASYSTIINGNINYGDGWHQTAASNRQAAVQITTLQTIYPSESTSKPPEVFTGFSGYEVRSNQNLNIKVLTSYFSNQILTQNVEVYGSSQVIQAMWNTFACNIVRWEDYYEEPSTWWIYLLIALLALLLLLLLLLLLWCCWKKCKNRGSDDGAAQDDQDKSSSYDDGNKKEPVKPQTQELANTSQPIKSKRNNGQKEIDFQL